MSFGLFPFSAGLLPPAVDCLMYRLPLVHDITLDVYKITHRTKSSLLNISVAWMWKYRRMEVGNPTGRTSFVVQLVAGPSCSC